MIRLNSYDSHSSRIGSRIAELIMVTLSTSSTLCSFIGIMLPQQINFGYRRKFEVKHARCGGFQIKASVKTPNKDDNSLRVTTSSILDDFVFRQNFTIKSYEVGANEKASIETLMNYFQDSAINHFKTCGIHRGGFGSTKEMIKRNLIWVFTHMRIEIYRYPVCDEVVQVEAWMSVAGKNAVRWNWLLRDSKTYQVLSKASSGCVMMNKLTRKLSKIPEEARKEFEFYFVNSSLMILEDDIKNIPKLNVTAADYICTGLKPRWNDLDINLHVSNVKYIGWVLESVPESILMNHELCGMSLEYKRECGRDSKLHSLTAICGANNNNVEFYHLLQLEDRGLEILRGRTKWRPKL
ncbi:hypothetical protein Ahy_B03g065610 [Arachis hypogaea]|uniref:Acyl-[acyl-carrier-protein] hydrolase n=2 Tax=Arachis TaxID=3817 RepID=A0A445A200_ARAHY|nr:hypothetical protein Ahy_B03g065610 [Arachis hypogaea]